MAVVICAIGWASGAVAQDDDAGDNVWLTPHMIELIVDRVVEQSSNIYGFDERQQAFFREQVGKRLPELIKKHQGTVQPILNEFLLYRIRDQVPTAQKVANWAQRTQPVLRDFIDSYTEVERKMRPLLRPEQRPKWSRDHFTAGLGCRLAEAKVQSLADGKFTPRDWHAPFPGPHLRAQQVRAQAEAAGLDTTPPPETLGNVIAGQGGQGAQPPPQGGQTQRAQADDDARQPSAERNYVPLDKWQSYTRQFISRYGLDEGQRTSAMAILKETRRRAQSYEKRWASELGRLRRKVRTASGESKSRLAAALAERERPLEEMYAEFQARLNNLLTASQRELTAPKR